MEGRCQYTVFFSAALNLQNIQITDKKLSPISPSFNPCGPCGPQRLPVLHHRGPRRISILAVLADCDKDWQGVFLDTDSISILAVLADRDSKDAQKTVASLYKAENILSAPKSFLREERKNNVSFPHPRTFAGANPFGIFWALGPRTRSSGSLPASRSACSQSARSCSRTFFPSSKSADCPAPGP